MYFNRGALPWQGIKANTKQEKYHKIMEKKISTQVDVLCKGFPAEFSIYLNYCRALRFEDKPDYAYLRRLFKDLASRENFDMTDTLFDWSLTDTTIRPEPVLIVDPVNEEAREEPRTRQGWLVRNLCCGSKSNLN
jgi:hypothetical protein